MHWASEDVSYMSYIQSNGHTLGAEQDDFSFSWDDKRVGTKVLLSKVTQFLTFFFLSQKKGHLVRPENDFHSLDFSKIHQCYWNYLVKLKKKKEYI